MLRGKIALSKPEEEKNRLCVKLYFTWSTHYTLWEERQYDPDSSFLFNISNTTVTMVETPGTGNL